MGLLFGTFVLWNGQFTGRKNEIPGRNRCGRGRVDGRNAPNSQGNLFRIRKTRRIFRRRKRKALRNHWDGSPEIFHPESRSEKRNFVQSERKCGFQRKYG